MYLDNECYIWRPSARRVLVFWMSKQEPKSLSAYSEILPLTSTKCHILRGEIGEMEAWVAELQELANSKDLQHEELKNKLLRVQIEAEADTEYLQKQVVEIKIKIELEHFRAMEKVREEHCVALLCKQILVDLERECAIEQVSALTASFTKKLRES